MLLQLWLSHLALGHTFQALGLAKVHGVLRANRRPRLRV